MITWCQPQLFTCQDVILKAAILTNGTKWGLIKKKKKKDRKEKNFVSLCVQKKKKEELLQVIQHSCSAGWTGEDVDPRAS